MEVNMRQTCAWIGTSYALIVAITLSGTDAHPATISQWAQRTGVLDLPVPQSSPTIDAVYWKYDNQSSFDAMNRSVFSELDLWLEFKPDGTFKETVWIKSKTTGEYNRALVDGPRVLRVRAGRYRIIENSGELVYEDTPRRPVRFTIPHRYMRFWPPEGFDMSNDPRLENPSETNWKLTEAVGVRPPEWKDF
jgi:hypothetical protein